jgi:hypothetical protein
MILSVSIVPNLGVPCHAHTATVSPEATAHPSSGARRRKAPRPPASSILPPAQSAALGERLVAEVPDLKSPDEAANWAKLSLRVKNSLTEADARIVETAFAARVVALNADNELIKPRHEVRSKRGPAHASCGEDDTVARQGAPRVCDSAAMPGVRATTIGRPSPAFRAAVRTSLARKVSDEYTVPLCRTHHRQLHRNGHEAAWWDGNKIDPLEMARRLWEQTRPGGFVS